VKAFLFHVPPKRREGTVFERVLFGELVRKLGTSYARG